MKIRYQHLIFFLVVGFLAGCSDYQKREKIEEAVRLEMQHYPKASLQDLYKNFFQDAFGPGHAIPDASVAMNYLKHELESATHYDSLLIQPLGYQHNYYRLNLLLIDEDKIPLDAYFLAFIKSAQEAEPPSLDEWIEEWHFILDVIEEMELNLPNYEKDRQSLDSLLASGKYVVHHSKEYGKHHHPHYRIIKKKYVDDLLGFIE